MYGKGLVPNLHLPQWAFGLLILLAARLAVAQLDAEAHGVGGHRRAHEGVRLLIQRRVHPGGLDPWLELGHRPKNFISVAWLVENKTK